MPSTVIANMHYDAERKNLTVHFVSGLVYEYVNVPEEVYVSMKTARSRGTYLNQHIKGHYQYRKIS